MSVSAAQGAALRPLLGLSLTKYREHKRFFKSVGVKFVSEDKERKQQRKAQCGEVQVKLRSLVLLNEEEPKEDLTLTPVASITDVPSLMRAQNIRDKFTALNSLFADIHTRISHQKPLSENGFDEAEKCTQRYMSYFRQQFPSVQIKQHLLEAHSVPFVRRWGFGLALHGEQGGEENARNC